MHTGALRALEWDAIVDVVRGFALTPLGAARLAELEPQSDPHRAGQLLSATAEGVRYLDTNPAFALNAPDDLDMVLSALAVEGRALDSLRLLAFAEFLDSLALTCATIRRVSGPFPALKQLAESCGSFKNQIADVRSKIDPSGEVNDNASPELGRLRTQMRKQRARLRSTLESYLRGKDTSRYLQDQVVSDRDGRYVLVVKAEHRSSIPGIIHGSSGSGASLYLEPLSTVEINNEIVALEQQEREEVHRILRQLTDAFRLKPIELRQAVDTAAELDVIQSKVRFAQLIGGVAPVLSTDGRLELRGARHPLLIPGVIARQMAEDDARRGRGEARDPVPVDVLVIPPTSVLLITGPNTGGKTVALKTAGLLALMAQAGLFVPAADARLPVFRTIFADIGDEQSIADSLSTFSWHITNIASMDRSLAQPALVLLDELGAGTDPLEGGALGVAIIEHFRTRGAIVISTTHYDALKTYAATTPGVTAAAFGFTPDTYEPTYHIQYGSPGRSLALEMAGRLGLNGAIIDNARKNLSAREAQLAEHLAKVDTDLRALEHERRLLKREREALGDADSRARVREEALRQREETFKLRLNEKLDERLRDARAEIDTIVADLKKQASALAEQASRNTATLSSTGDTGRLRGDARAAVDALVDKYRNDPAPVPSVEAAPTRHVAVGDRVVLGTLGLEGIVVNVHDREAEVEVRGKRFRSLTTELRLLGGSAPRPESASVRVNVQLQPREGVSTSELLLVGNTVDQAIDRLEKFLDESLLSEQRTLRLIHGFGTGRLKEAVVDYLHKHPLVTSVRTASPQEGGGGVTIAELKD